MAVRGMTCTACEQRVMTALGAVPGVVKASADHRVGIVTLRFDPPVAGEHVVRGVIEELSYGVVM